MGSTKDRQESFIRVGSTSAWSVSPTRPSEHHAVGQFLMAMVPGLTHAAFQCQLDDPFYEPRDRLLCRVREELIGHLLLQSRELHFDGVVFPASVLTELIVSQPYRGRGVAVELVGQAEQMLVADGTVMGLTRSRRPQFWLRHGWVPWSRHSYSSASAREILAQLRGSPTSRQAEASAPMTIRPFRHIELAGLMRLYTEQARTACGAFERSEAYWNWLIARHGFDAIYVALHGPHRFHLERGADSMVGYAATRQGRIIELVTSTGHPEAAEALVSRICADAIEQDGQFVRLDAPVAHPLHMQIARAGGELGYHESLNGDVSLAKILHWPAFMRQLGGLLSRRLVAADRPPFTELPVQIGSSHFLLEVQPDRVELQPLDAGRPAVSGSESAWTQLVLGHLELGTAIKLGRLLSHSTAATELLSVLFPQVSLWRPPWDEIASRRS